MPLAISATQPAQLLAKIKKAIDDKKIDTWSYDSDGDFTHTPSQWNNKAWLKPQVGQGVLAFTIVGQKDVQMTREVYGVYHGRFIEMLLVHFERDLTSATAT